MVLIASRSLWLAQTNTYVVAPAPGKQGVLVDAPPDPSGMVELLEQYQITPVAMLITHGHVDHIGGGGTISDKFSLSGYVHPDDDFLTLDLASQYQLLLGASPPPDLRPPTRRINLEHGQEITLAGLEFQVLHTPGHTPGHCCFLLPAAQTLFSGDQLFAGGIGRTDLPGGDSEKLFSSMANQVMVLDDQVRVLPGHGPETTIGEERRTNPFRSYWQ